MNKELLLRICDEITKEPRRLDMAIYAMRSRHPGCGTVGCIAGWACFLTHERGDLGVYEDMVQAAAADGTSFSVVAHAADALGLCVNAELSRLFYLDSWPARFRDDYHDADELSSPEEIWAAKAAATVARIHHFIETRE